MKSFFSICILVMVWVLNPYTLYAQPSYDTITCAFESLSAVLMDEEQTVLENTIQNDTRFQSNKLIVYGLLDEHTTNLNDKTLADKRCTYLKQILLDNGVAKEQIVYSAGVAKPGFEFNRNGMILIRKESQVKIVRNAVTVVTEGDVDARPASASATNNQTLADQLTHLKINQTLPLENLLFYAERHRLIPDAKPVLDELLEVLQEDESLIISIEGHVCCVEIGQDALDIESGEFNLSEERAKYVYDYLIKNGIQKRRLSYKGLGKTKPLIHPETTDEDKLRNRRVEIRLVARDDSEE